ncbi:AraC family transcriptional regulator of adaptative response / DNA-3-methyladenine glycosylase II [Marisediminicola sp. UYEF4]|uniref:DNA-3-methyladenine glycosylase 2 family protein n=1 Tax=Marisediminicola sp. UYEF4 TaxID=1756384 RepID=UPI0033912A01
MSITAAVGPADPLFAARYLAVSSRDARFDGQFITGVRSTGIYCRPSCPALTPKASNVTFYRTAAAAHEAGLRACKRCQPDAVPGSPEWNSRDDLASRAMRLIADGTVDRRGVPGLAETLGYTPRHLTRVLVQELGAGPLALARAHRAQTARTLLAATDLPIADVAFAAGFSSVRQFNETIAAVYERTPTQLRASAQRAPAPNRSSAGESTAVTLRLPARAPFDGEGLLRFFADHAIPGVESGGAMHYARRVRLPRGTAMIELGLDRGHAGESVVTCAARLDNVADLSTLVARVRRLFDLDADAAAIDEALSRDPALAPSVARNPGVRLPGSLDSEETLFRTLIGQQVSVAAARTVLARICLDLCGDSGLFPTATQLADEGRRVLRGPAPRVAAIIGVAEALANRSLVIDVGMPASELIARLVAMPGIGPWTAGYVAMRVLGNPDVLISGDLVMLRSAALLGLPATRPGLAAHGERWAPWRSYVGMHLWRSANR